MTIEIFHMAKSCEEYFKESEHFFYVLFDKQGQIISSNNAFRKNCSRISTNGEVLPRFHFKEKNSVASIEAMIRQCLEHPQQIFSSIVQVSTLSGAVLDITLEWKGCSTDNGITTIQAIGAISTSHDKDLYLATLIENVSDIIISQDNDFDIVSWNKAAETVYGYTAREVIGRKVNEFLHFEFKGISREEFFRHLEKERIWKGEAYVKNRMGMPLIVLMTISTIIDMNGNATGYVSVSKDMTHIRKTEEELEQSEDFYRNLIAYSPDGILLTTAEGKITYCGSSVKSLSGYDAESLIGKQIFEFVHPGDLPVAYQSFQLELKKQSTTNYVVVRLKHSSGKWVWCSIRGHNLLQNEAVNAIVIYFANDTKRKWVEDKLRQNEQQFRGLIYNLRQGVILDDRNKKTIICNQAALQMLGLSAEQLYGNAPISPAWHAMHENGEDFPRHLHPIPVALNTKSSIRDVVMGIYRPETNDRVWLLVNAEPFLNDDGTVSSILCSFTDITEQKRLARELIQYEIQKQKQITQATIDGQEKERQEIGKELHDNINQHLNTTRLYLEVAREKASDEVLEMIHLAHKNLSNIVDEIRHLSQSLVLPSLGDIGLVESIQDLCEDLKRTYTFKIGFFYRYFDERTLPENFKLMLFRIVQEQINNIITHAQATEVELKLQSDAEAIILLVGDNGVGFDPDKIKKGLGFINIENRISLFNGSMELKTAPGQGCAVTITIPTAAQ